MAGAVEAFRRRAGGWPGGLSEGRECRALAADSPYRFVFDRRPRGRRVEESAVRLPQRSLRSEDNRTAEAVLPLEQGSGRLAGRGLAGVFPQGGSGLRLVGLGCVVVPGAGAGRRTVWKGSVPGAGAGRRTVWKGSGWRLSELGATGSGAVGGAGGSGEGGKTAR